MSNDFYRRLDEATRIGPGVRKILETPISYDDSTLIPESPPSPVPLGEPAQTEETVDELIATLKPHTAYVEMQIRLGLGWIQITDIEDKIASENWGKQNKAYLDLRSQRCRELRLIRVAYELLLERNTALATKAVPITDEPELVAMRHLLKRMYDECGPESWGKFRDRVNSGEHDVPSPWLKAVPIGEGERHSMQVTYVGKGAKAECACGWTCIQTCEVSAGGFVHGVAAEHLRLSDLRSQERPEDAWERSQEEMNYRYCEKIRDLFHVPDDKAVIGLNIAPYTPPK